VIECLDRLSKRGRKLVIWSFYTIDLFSFADTIIFSIHQPRYSIFKLFDTLFLIAAGHCIYHGPTFDILPFFASVGFTCEEHDNPADFILDVSQGIRSTSSPVIEIDIDLNQRKDKLARDLHNVYIKSPNYASICQEITDTNMLSNGVLNRQTQLMRRSCLMEMFYVSQRTLRNSFRNSAVMITHTIVPVCLALLIGFLYMNTDRTLGKGIKNRLGSIFFIVANQVFLNLSGLELFIIERQLFIHENASGYYHMSTYFISKLICDIFPIRLIPSVLFSVIVYFLIGFQRTVAKFFIFLLDIFATSVCTSSTIFFISASVPNFGEIL
jgi:ATP-binding cassette subfamily G (WHITE) protein 2